MLPSFGFGFGDLIGFLEEEYNFFVILEGWSGRRERFCLRFKKNGIVGGVLTIVVISIKTCYRWYWILLL